MVSRDVIAHGFEFGGARVRFVEPQGIFKPVMMDLPLSITTSPNSPYDDEMGADKLLRYKYRGEDPYHRDNVGLRTAMEYRLPLVYFHGLVPGRYMAIWPVYVVGDAMGALEFSVTCEASTLIDPVFSLQDERRAVRGVEEGVCGDGGAASDTSGGVPGAGVAGVSEPVRVLCSAARRVVGCGAYYAG